MTFASEILLGQNARFRDVPGSNYTMRFDWPIAVTDEHLGYANWYENPDFGTVTTTGRQNSFLAKTKVLAS
jgi:hypothetical protein